MVGKAISTLLGVACLLSACRGDDTGAPMGARGAPEVVLQLKYQEGELDRIYVTQFRKTGLRPVPAQTELCADLCHAGLGGESCGASCTGMLPVGLALALRSDNQTAAQYGEPRVRVCPTLCANKLGKPLCNCPAVPEDVELVVDYASVCAAFCLTDGYVLGGCPACEGVPVSTAPAQLASIRILNTSEGWVFWCDVQCRQGHGGAACNCDRAPFQ